VILTDRQRGRVASVNRPLAQKTLSGSLRESFFRPLSAAVPGVREFLPVAAPAARLLRGPLRCRTFVGILRVALLLPTANVRRMRARALRSADSVSMRFREAFAAMRVESMPRGPSGQSVGRANSPRA